jgi:hypothetical protein
MASFRIDVKVNDKGAAAAIARLIAALDGAPLEAAVLAGAEAVADHAKGFVAVDTGALRDNIRAEGA